MDKRTGQNITLGLFVTAGILILVVSLYLIGRNQSMFGSTFHVRARFRNVSGLQAGNNVRLSGIQAGTVGKVTVLDDTTIEVDLMVEEEMKPFIRNNSLVSIGNEGLMGNKVVNITPAKIPGALATENTLLPSKADINTDQMIESFSNVGGNVEVISGELVNTVNRINQSRALWSILNDTVMSAELHSAITNLRMATDNINDLTVALQGIVTEAKSGRGAAGAIISDPKVAGDLREAVANIKEASAESVSLLVNIDSLVTTAKKDIQHGDGLASAVLNDTSMTGRVNRSLRHVEEGTASFNEAMKALKQNFLFRRYFKKQQRKKQVAGGKSTY